MHPGHSAAGLFASNGVAPWRRLRTRCIVAKQGGRVGPLAVVDEKPTGNSSVLGAESAATRRPPSRVRRSAAGPKYRRQQAAGTDRTADKNAAGSLRR